MFMKNKKREAAGRPTDKKDQAHRPEAGKNRAGAPEPRRRPTEEGRNPSTPESKRRPPEEGRKPSAPEGRRRPSEEGRRPSAPESRRRPSEEGRRPSAPEGRRRPSEDGRRPSAPESRRRPSEDGRRPSAPESRRRPPENGRRPSAPEGRRRPSEEERKSAASESRRRPPEEGRRPAAPEQPQNAQSSPEQTEAAQAVSRENLTAEDLIRELNPAVPAEAEEGVYKIQQQPRKTPSTSRGTARKQAERPKTRREKQGGVREAPQGTSYHRSTPKQKKTLRDMVFKPGSKYYKDPDQQAAAARARKAAREEQKKKLKRLAAKLDTPAIVYTEPKPFNRNRLLVQLVSVLAVACAFVMALSIFFKVEYITVSGTETYSPHVVQEASGIHVGDSLLTFGRARASGLIIANLPYANSVRIGIKLPNTVNIDVEEADIAYSIKSGDGDWWLITSEGKVVQQIPGSTAKNYTQVLGVLADKPEVGQPIMAVEETPEETAAAGEEKKDGAKKETEKDTKKDGKKDEKSKLDVPVAVSGSMRLSAALRILIALEENDIVGDAASVNVENLEKIELWYGQRYQVNLGDAEQLDYKVACMYDAILQLSDYQTGMLDVSFTKKADQVIYTPFV